MLRHYPSYRLPDFFTKTFLQGGITRNQLMFLFDSADKERYEDHRFMAAIQGIDIEADSNSEKGSTPGSVDINLEKESFAFRDPKDYEHLSEGERALMTTDMLEHWKKFSLHSSPKKS